MADSQEDGSKGGVCAGYGLLCIGVPLGLVSTMGPSDSDSGCGIERKRRRFSLDSPPTARDTDHDSRVICSRGKRRSILRTTRRTDDFRPAPLASASRRPTGG